MPPLQSVLQGTEEKNLPQRRGGTEKTQTARENLLKRGGTEAAEDIAQNSYRGSTRMNADKDWGDILRPMNPRQQSGVAKAPAILLLLAVAIFVAGAGRYHRHGNFTLAQAAYCLVAVVVSLVVLLIFDYTLHHAKIAAVMVLVFVVLFLVASPAFCVGMGLGLAGMVVVQSRG